MPMARPSLTAAPAIWSKPLIGRPSSSAWLAFCIRSTSDTSPCVAVRSLPSSPTDPAPASDLKAVDTLSFLPACSRSWPSWRTTPDTVLKTDTAACTPSRVSVSRETPPVAAPAWEPTAPMRSVTSASGMPSLLAASPMENSRSANASAPSLPCWEKASPICLLRSGKRSNLAALAVARASPSMSRSNFWTWADDFSVWLPMSDSPWRMRSAAASNCPVSRRTLTLMSFEPPPNTATYRLPPPPCLAFQSCHSRIMPFSDRIVSTLSSSRPLSLSSFCCMWAYPGVLLSISA